MKLLTDKIAMVTGAGSGIGRATCFKFIQEGATVAALDINPELGEKTVAQIIEKGGKAMFFQADVSDETHIQQTVSHIVTHWGALHLASNNAALAVGSHLLADYPADEFTQTYQTTLNSVFYCMKHQIPAMIEAGGGAIVNIGSRAAINPNMYMSAYDSAKAAVNGVTRNAAKEYATHNIRVNCINPGVVKTEGIKKYLASNEKHEARFLRGIAMKRLAEPEELADAIAWLCSARASYITGQSINVDGGMI